LQQLTDILSQLPTSIYTNEDKDLLFVFFESFSHEELMLWGILPPPMRIPPLEQHSLHQDCVHNFELFRQKAADEAQLQLKIVSSYRSFFRQLTIWEDKVQGKRPLWNKKGDQLLQKEQIQQLSSYDLVQTILRWSALPGWSRHHWGTDFDLIASNLVPADYQVQLIPSEFEQQGYFYPLHQWLSQYEREEEKLIFFRPYQFDTGGISPEAWHLSYAPLASRYTQQFSLKRYQEFLEQWPCQFLLRDVILNHLHSLFQQFFVIT
jgi:LAS superfamily LD-carboxypeptidase LdcB